MATVCAVIASTHHPFYYRASTATGAARPPFADEWVAKIEKFRETLTGARPDVLVMVGSDHFHQLWLDNSRSSSSGRRRCTTRTSTTRNGNRLPRLLLNGHEDLSATCCATGLTPGST